MHPQHNIQARDVEKDLLMKDMTQTELGLSFLKWLCNLCGWNKSLMNNEDAARRDIWLLIRRFIPVEKLATIEYADLVAEQEYLQEQLRVQEEIKDND